MAWRAKFYPLDRSPYEDERSLPAEKAKALRDERSDGVAAAVEEDAWRITFGRSITFWGAARARWAARARGGTRGASVVDSLMVPLGMKAPNFSLPDPSGIVHHLASLADAPAVLVMFLCNHCPYVKHVRHGIAELAADYVPRGLGVVGINANDFERYPEDAPPRMAEFAAEAGWAFPYVYDERQAVARAYGAACTPDFFLFDGSATLVYRGQMDRSRPGNDVPVSGEDLRRAIDAVLAGQPVQQEQWPSTGCSIKWRSGNELA